MFIDLLLSARLPRIALRHLALSAALVAVLAAGNAQARTQRHPDASNLRQISMAASIYAHDHDDQLPRATDVWAYAGELANKGGLESPEMWISRRDPAFETLPYNSGLRILAPRTTSKPLPIDPAFRDLKLSVAVALGELNMTMPATTPIAWTRGLQKDGTWATHSPYGRDGGYISFLGGNIRFYRNLQEADNQLTRFDGNGKTSNILEALPPGTRIGEYTPSAEEQKAWTRKNRIRSFFSSIPPEVVWFALLWAPFIALSIYRFIKRKPGVISILLWPLILTVLIAIIAPTVAS